MLSLANTLKVKLFSNILTETNFDLLCVCLTSKDNKLTYTENSIQNIVGFWQLFRQFTIAVIDFSKNIVKLIYPSLTSYSEPLFDPMDIVFFSNQGSLVELKVKLCIGF